MANARLDRRKNRAGRGRLSDGPRRVNLLLQPVQKVGGTLRMGGGGENGALVVAQHVEPRRNIGGVVGARLGGDPEVGAEEGRTDLGDQFLGGGAGIAPALSPEIPRQARGMPSSMAIMPISA